MKEFGGEDDKRTKKKVQKRRNPEKLKVQNQWKKETVLKMKRGLGRMKK